MQGGNRVCGLGGFALQREGMLLPRPGSDYPKMREPAVVGELQDQRDRRRGETGG